MSDELKIDRLYNLDETIAAKLFVGLEYPWQALPLIGDFIKELGRNRLIRLNMMRFLRTYG